MGYFAFDHAKIGEEATVRVLKAAKDAGKFARHFALSAEIGKPSSKIYFHHKYANGRQNSCPKVETRIRIYELWGRHFCCDSVDE